MNGRRNVKDKGGGGGVYALYIAVTTMQVEQTRYYVFFQVPFPPLTNYTHGVIQ